MLHQKRNSILFMYSFIFFAVYLQQRWWTNKPPRFLEPMLLSWSQICLPETLPHITQWRQTHPYPTMHLGQVHLGVTAGLVPLEAISSHFRISGMVERWDVRQWLPPSSAKCLLASAPERLNCQHLCLCVTTPQLCTLTQSNFRLCSI